MSDIRRNEKLRGAFEKAIEAEHSALLASAPPEELEKAPSEEFERRMEALFAGGKKREKGLPPFLRGALLAAAAIAVTIALLAILGLFSKGPNGPIDVHNNTPAPTASVPFSEPPESDAPPTETGTDLPSAPPSDTATIFNTDTPGPTGGVTATPGPTDRPTPVQTDRPTDRPTDQPTGTLPPLTEQPTDAPTLPPPVTERPTEEPTPVPPPTEMPTAVPTEPPIEPTEPPIEPTEPPVEPTEPPIEPTEPPVEPTVAPTEPPYHPGDIITFGRYEQDDSVSDGAEEIEWIVLSVTNGRMLVISRYALDAAPYNDAAGDITWKLCTLRTGFMSGFLNEAFTAEERSRIILQYVQTPNNPVYGTPGGGNAFDRLFLLSINEASSLMGVNLRRCEATAYARARGVYTHGGYCCWWLRSPGSLPSNAAFVNYQGGVDNAGAAAETPSFGVRPAMWISIP